MNAESEQAQDIQSPDWGDALNFVPGTEVEDQESLLDSPELTVALEQATRRADENWDKLLRVQAEMENLRRRTEKDLDNARKFALERFVKDLLPVIDSLELGIQASVGEAADMVRLREGSELTLKQFTDVLGRFNVVAIDPATGEKFNPDQHQAMAVDPSAPGEANTVVKVFQKGYLLNERLLRPAMVVIAQGGVEAPTANE